MTNVKPFRVDPLSISPSSSPSHFDDRTALHLVQAFHQQTDLHELVQMMFSQLRVLTKAHGLRLVLPATYRTPEISLGRNTLHNVEYNLDAETTHLGTLTVFFPTRKNEQELTTCEDLISLAFTALRNATALHVSRHSSLEAPPTQSKQTDLEEHKSDALILVTLDCYTEMRTNDGEEWAHAVMSSVHAQILEGLRTADGVYQISDEYIAVLLPNTTITQAEAVAGKIRVLIASLHLKNEEVEEQLTACMGLADSRLATTAEEVMSNAKVALALAQHQGSNQLKTYDESMLPR